MKKKILVIDDENIVLDLMTRIMKGNGYRVYGCTNADKAIEFATKRLPDLIISDYDLSEIENGVDLALSIRRSTNMGIPVIIMSGSPQNGQKAMANEFEFIKKPFNKVELIGLVERSFVSSRNGQHCNNILVEMARSSNG
jgi:response regulator NasT